MPSSPTSLNQVQGGLWKGCRVTVMGLGSFGGGVGLARHLAEQDASVTVTDLKDAAALPDAVAALQGLPVRFVLGEHRDGDFIDTDMSSSTPRCRLARRICNWRARTGCRWTVS